MIKVAMVRFHPAGKLYSFDMGALDVRPHMPVIVETVRGVEIGEAVLVADMNEDAVKELLKPVLRIADEADLYIHKKNLEKAKEARAICVEKVREHGLPMKIVDCEYTFDMNKVIFYFTADGRVDFRDLVKDLASVFRTRIELRQIGVRDHAKLIGALSSCGEVCCCSRFLTEFEPVSIKMAKEQALSLNPAKISGVCGRLMCCLRYENDVYVDKNKRVPRVGALVETDVGRGVVISSEVLRERVKVRLLDEDDPEVNEYDASEVKVIARRCPKA